MLNPATISLTPGTIIPKAVDPPDFSRRTPGRIDLSERLIEQLRANVRRALLNDKLSQLNMPTMTATESCNGPRWAGFWARPLAVYSRTVDADDFPRHSILIHKAARSPI